MNEIELSLTDLAEAINDAHRQCIGAIRAGLTHAIKAGEYLTRAKEQCDHGQWLPWLAENVTFSERTAQNYMRVYGRRAELEAKAQHVADLPYREAVMLLAEPKEPESMTEPEARAWIEDIRQLLVNREELITFVEVSNAIQKVKKVLTPEAFEKWLKDKTGTMPEFEAGCAEIAGTLTRSWCQWAAGRLESEDITLQECLTIQKEAARLEIDWAEFQLRTGRKMGEILTKANITKD